MLQVCNEHGDLGRRKQWSVTYLNNNAILTVEPVLSALGEAVNTAARLERASKVMQQPVVVSGDTLEAAKLSHQVALRDISLRGRSEPLAVAPLNAQRLRELLNTVDFA